MKKFVRKQASQVAKQVWSDPTFAFTFGVVLTLFAASLTVAATITINLAYPLLVLAWVVAWAGTFLVPWTVSPSHRLAMAFWGAPAGGSPDMERVGTIIDDAFRQHGFTVDWNGSGAERPIVNLRDVGAAEATPGVTSIFMRAKRKPPGSRRSGG